MSSDSLDSSLVSVVDPSWVEETDLIFLGTGSSGGTPKLSCLTGPAAAKRCPTCFDGILPGSPNNRRNTSAVIRTQWFEVRVGIHLYSMEARIGHVFRC